MSRSSHNDFVTSIPSQGFKGVPNFTPTLTLIMKIQSNHQKEEEHDADDNDYARHSFAN